MQMIQDGPFASAPEKPLRMTGSLMNCKVSAYHSVTCILAISISLIDYSSRSYYKYILSLMGMISKPYTSLHTCPYVFPAVVRDH